MSGARRECVVGRKAVIHEMREARVTIQLRQLEVRTGDFLNGTRSPRPLVTNLNVF
jgi:hypothetical protein